MAGFLIGVLASLVAAVLWSLISKHGVFGLRAMFWEGTNISGRWNAYLQDPKVVKPTGHADIVQIGDRITMTLHRQEDREGRPASRDYRYQGRFRSRQLTLLWEAIDRPDYRIGAMVLHLNEGGNRFRGVTVFHDDKFDGVGTLEYWLEKAPR